MLYATGIHSAGCFLCSIYVFSKTAIQQIRFFCVGFYLLLKIGILLWKSSNIRRACHHGVDDHAECIRVFVWLES
jgi:hypothetical protein